MLTYFDNFDNFIQKERGGEFPLELKSLPIEKLKHPTFHLGSAGLGLLMIITIMLKVMMMIMMRIMMIIMIFRCVLEEVEVETLEKKPILECTHR